MNTVNGLSGSQKTMSGATSQSVDIGSVTMSDIASTGALTNQALTFYGTAPVWAGLSSVYISNFDTQVNTHAPNNLTPCTASLNMNTEQITALVDPTQVQGAATKNYVDTQFSSITAGTNPKITYNAKGLVTGSTTLVASDIPTINLNQMSTSSASNGQVIEYNGTTPISTTPSILLGTANQILTTNSGGTATAWTSSLPLSSLSTSSTGTGQIIQYNGATPIWTTPVTINLLNNSFST